MSKFDKWLKLIETKELLCEMSNLKERDTNLPYCVTITTKQHTGGPRLKVNLGKNCISEIEIHYNISSSPVVTIDTLGNTKYFKDKKAIKKIINMIKIFEKELLVYWFNVACIKDETILIKQIKSFLRNGKFDMNKIKIEKECFNKINQIKEV